MMRFDVGESPDPELMAAEIEALKETVARQGAVLEGLLAVVEAMRTVSVPSVWTETPYPGNATITTGACISRNGVQA